MIFLSPYRLIAAKPQTCGASGACRRESAFTISFAFPSPFFLLVSDIDISNNTTFPYKPPLHLRGIVGISSRRTARFNRIKKLQYFIHSFFSTVIFTVVLPRSQMFAQTFWRLHGKWPRINKFVRLRYMQHVQTRLCFENVRVIEKIKYRDKFMQTIVSAVYSLIRFSPYCRVIARVPQVLAFHKWRSQEGCDGRKHGEWSERGWEETPRRR